MDPDEYEDREDAEPEGDDIRGIGADDDDDDEEEEEGQDEYERDGWMVDEEEEEEEGGEEAEGEDEEEEDEDEEERAGKGERGGEEEEEHQERKKKKKRRKREDELDEDDYELLEENDVRGIRRPVKKDKKFKRLKKAKKSGDDGRGLFDDDEEDAGIHTAQERVEREIFDDEGAPADFQEAGFGGGEDLLPGDEGLAGEDLGEEDDEELGDEEEDEMADFIVEGREEVDETGRRRRRRKKKGARMDGVTAEALLEAQDIFGDVAELLEVRRQQLEAQKYAAEERREGEEWGEGEEEAAERRKKAALEAQYEPSLLESQFLTKRDDEIRKRDVPERIQLLEEVVGAFPEGEDSEAEAEWVFSHVFGRDAPPHARRPEFAAVLEAEHRARTCPADRAKEAQAAAAAAKERALREIASVLEQMHEKKVEVPYIGLHRKNLCPSLVDPDTLDEKPRLQTFEALWAIQRWDVRWLLLQRRRRSLWAAYSRPRRDEDEEAERQLALPGVEHALLSARSELALDDVDVKFNLQFPPEDAGGGGRREGGGKEVQPRQKRPQKRSMYAVCRRAGLKMVVKAMGLSSFQLGDNLAHMYKFHEVEDPAVPPDAVAAEYVCAEFSDVSTVLRAARHMAVVEISVEPGVKEHVRAFFHERAIVTTRPTSRGKQVIDTFHRYSGTEWLTGKPLAEFRDEQWLLVAKAQQEGLLEVTLGLTPADEEMLMADFTNAYTSDGVSHAAKLWNEQRQLVLREALSSRLLPAMQREARLALTARAKDHLSAQCSAAMWQRISVAPYDLRAATHGSRGGRGAEEEGGRRPWLRVLACCWGPGQPATTFAMLEASGELLETLHTPFLCARVGREGDPEYSVMLQRKEADEERLRRLMMAHRPHVVVVAACNLACRKLKEAVFEVINVIVDRHPKSLPPEVDNVQVIYEDDVFASLYEKSAASLKHFPDQPGIVRRAVGLGRYFQNRLALIGTLFGAQQEVLAARLHAAQDLLPAEEVLAAFERSMVGVTNQVGVDVNYAASSAQDWLFSPLQFVCGLGPRKALALQSAIVAEGVVRRRSALVQPPFSLGPTVFVNAAAAIRLRAQDDLLDDSRIHPADYRLALKLALEGYCVARGGSLTAEEAEERGIDVAAEVRENPELIRRLDFEGYVADLERSGQGSLKEKLLLIRRELMHGFAEARLVFKTPDESEEFLMLSGETDETLAIGRVVTATVRKVLPARVLCALESGLLAVVDRRDFSDDPNVELEAVVKPGSVVTGRIKEVRKGLDEVILTCKGADLRSDMWRQRRSWDPFYAPLRAEAEAQAAEAEERRKKEEARRKLLFRPRMIDFPLFKNVSAEEAMEMLASRDVGDVVLRPSKRGPSHLSISMKFADGVVTTVDIEESGKDRSSAASLLRLGRTLRIGEETFEDLDEVMARYVEPVAGFVRDMTRYRKFRQGSKAEIDNLLREQKEREPARIPYFIAPSHEHRGAFMLAYIRSSRPIHEYITVSPKGYRYRKNNFATPDYLVKYFQQHFNDPVPQPEAAIIPRRAVAAMVPTAPFPGGPYSHPALPGPPHAAPSDAHAGRGYPPWNSSGRGPSHPAGRQSGWGPPVDAGGSALPPSGPGYGAMQSYDGRQARGHGMPGGGYPQQAGDGGGVGWGQGSWDQRGSGKPGPSGWEGSQALQPRNERDGRQSGWNPPGTVTS